jgi:hypothetical protein
MAAIEIRDRAGYSHRPGKVAEVICSTPWRAGRTGSMVTGQGDKGHRQQLANLDLTSLGFLYQ